MESQQQQTVSASLTNSLVQPANDFRYCLTLRDHHNWCKPLECGKKRKSPQPGKICRKLTQPQTQRPRVKTKVKLCDVENSSSWNSLCLNSGYPTVKQKQKLKAHVTPTTPSHSSYFFGLTLDFFPLSLLKLSCFKSGLSPVLFGTWLFSSTSCPTRYSSSLWIVLGNLFSGNSFFFLPRLQFH